MLYRTGCAVWAYRGWVGRLYPPGTPQSEFFDAYVARMTSVEGNSMFYAIPSPDQVRQWAARMPEGFTICPKLNRAFTHEGLLCGHARQIADFRDRMRGFGEHLGPIMVQLPPTYAPEHLDDLATFLGTWPHHEVPVGVEVRNLGWWADHHASRLNELLSYYNAARILLDTRPIFAGQDDPQMHSERRKPRLPVNPEVTASFTIIRYIGHPDPARNEFFLRGWADKVTRWLDAGVEVMFFAHCPEEEHSPAIARRFQAMLEDRGAPVDPLPWDLLPPPPTQLGLFL